MQSHHFIVGGQRSGKSRHAERLARDWLARDPRHEVVVVATALAGDEEMRQRIERHRLDRPYGFAVVECAQGLGETVRLQSAQHRMVLVDCLTLWVSQLLMPPDLPSSRSVYAPWPELRDDLLSALSEASGPVVLVRMELRLDSVGKLVFMIGDGWRFVWVQAARAEAAASTRRAGTVTRAPAPARARTVSRPMPE